MTAENGLYQCHSRRERATGIEPPFSAWEVTPGRFRHLRLFADLAFYQDFRVRQLPANDIELRTVRARIAHDSVGRWSPNGLDAAVG